MSKQNFLRRTERGFKVYGELTDRHNQGIRILESSAVGRPTAYLFIDRAEPGNPHLNLDVVKALEMIASLQRFVDDARDDENWRNEENYVKEFG